MKKVVSLALTALFAISILSGLKAVQSPQIEQQSIGKTYGGTGSDGGMSMVQTSDGGYALSCVTTSFGGGDQDFWVIKTDANFNPEWNKTYGGSGSEAPGYRSIVQTNDGYALVGRYSESDYDHSDLWLIKIDSNGNTQWNKTFGGANRDEATCFVQSDDGGFVIAGATRSFGAGATDGWLVKTDASGNMEWNRTYGGGGWDGFRGMKRTTDGGYILAGVYEATNGWDFWLLKTDAEGNEAWSKFYGIGRDDDAFDVVQTNDGGYALTGFAETASAGRDMWLVKTDANGNMQWNRTYGGTGNENGCSIMQTNDGGYLQAGDTSSFGSGNRDGWLVKTDANGNMQWNRTYGGTNDDFVRDFIQTLNGGLALIGQTKSFGSGDDDVWIIKTTGAQVHDVAVVDVVPFKTVVAQGNRTFIMVTVENQGDFTETFNVTAYYDQTVIIIEKWPDGENSQDFWSMGDVSRDGYIDLWDQYKISQAFGSNPEHPRWNPDADINSDGKVDARDLGTFAKNFGKDIWTSLGIPKIIENQRAVTLSSGNSATIAFRWNTTGVVKGNYTISAYAWSVTGETETTDNTLIDGWIVITILGDINGDRNVDIFDVVLAALALDSRPGDPDWNPNADIVEDYVIDIYDIVTVATRFGTSDPP